MRAKKPVRGKHIDAVTLRANPEFAARVGSVPRPSSASSPVSVAGLRCWRATAENATLRPPGGSVLILDERPGSASFDAPGGPPLRNIVQLSVAVLICERQVRANQQATVTKLFAQ